MLCTLSYGTSCLLHVLILLHVLALTSRLGSGLSSDSCSKCSNAAGAELTGHTFCMLSPPQTTCMGTLHVQVHQVFAALCPSVGLTLGLAAARSTLAVEVSAIMGMTGTDSLAAASAASMR